MDQDYMLASAIVVFSLLSGLDHKPSREDDPTCTLKTEFNSGNFGIYEFSGLTTIANWPNPGQFVHVLGEHVSMDRT